jgi:PAS domain S-box-containing protein
MPSEQAGEHGMIRGTDGAWVPRPVDDTPRADSPRLRPTAIDREPAASLARRTLADDHSKSAGVDAERASVSMLRSSLDSLVTLLERVSRGMRASVLLLDEDGVTLRHGAAPHLPAAYNQAIDGAHIGPAVGSCGTAAYRRERVIVRDTSTDPLWADYRDLAETYGLAACWSTPILDGDGEVLGTFAMYYDEPREPTSDDIALTETATLLARNVIKRARTEAALRWRTEVAERLADALGVSEERFRSMAEAIPVQVWTAQPDGLLNFVTKKAAEYFGQPVSELLGTGWTRVVHPDDVERASERWRQSLETGEPYEVEFRIFSARDGDYRWHLVRASAARDADGRITQWFGCNADIEDQKRLQAALDAALDETKRANKAKSDFLAMMSHELRTPLNAIGGYAQLMIDGIPTPASDGQLNYLRRIAKSQQHLLGLIEAVLLHARVEAGKVTYQIADFWAREVLEVVDSLTAPQRAAKRLSYDSDGCDPKLVFHADKQKVVQILLNVLSNATKFTPREGRIIVTTSVLGPGVGAFSVRDTGIGMSPKELEVVFEPYVQFDNPLAREHKGTGLGMPISRELARGMSGDLTASSEPGVGSIFTLSLPLAETTGGA